ncbi:MAG TPA: DoxX family protein [Luteolibacter sp.]|nr:DoxX family protein [Luteolibacter sp.]
MKRFLFDCGTRDTIASIGIFALRVMIGLMMLVGHGWGKIENFAKLREKFHVPDFMPLKLMSPSVSLSAAIAAEVGAAVLIVLGLCTRPAAFVLGFTMVIAAFSAMADFPWFIGPGVPVAKEPALLYLIPMVAIILTGAGSWSLDAAIYKGDKRRRW